MKLPVVNHQDYVAKINDDNKFPIRKFGELANYLINQKIVDRFYKPDYCSEETLSRAHSLEYIASIKKKTIDTKSQKKIGFLVFSGAAAENQKIFRKNERKIARRARKGPRKTLGRFMVIFKHF